jgi:hypothetical protein
MTSLIQSINTKREETIAKHYEEALSDLQKQVELNPLQTKFFIYAGCVSSEITKEIARRFNLEGIKTEVCRSGLLTSTWYLDVEAELPESLASKETSPADLTSYTLTEDEQKVVEATPLEQN